MNWRTFTALLARDAHVARRNYLTLMLQTLLQPLLFVFIFGQVMIRSGLMAASYKGMLLPGIMAISMVFSGIQAVAMPLIAEFQFTREIEDRLLAPIRIEWLAVEKIFAGMLQALLAGMVVLPAAWLLLGSGTGVTLGQPVAFVSVAVLVALFSASGGLLLGCTVGQTNIGLMFSLVLTPMIMFGCAYYPWSALGAFPVIQKLVLLNPLVYASEGLRGTLAPQYPHLSIALILVVLGVIDVLLIAAGLDRFYRKAVS
jgi:ABC-2 type transport system permease protein